MRRTYLVSMIAALLAATPLAAQTGRISGTVTSADGARPLAGASVAAAGSSARATTGPDGSYTLSIAPGTYRLTASVLGHTAETRSVTVAAGGAVTANFQLQPAAVALEGLVAIGYGERRIRDVTGSVEAVGEEEFNTGRVVSPEQLIQGKVAGVQVVDNGEPGGGLSIRVRGGTSVNASNEPLFVVDGVPLQPGGGLSAGRNPMNFINPEDIASITVLKDAASTAIYGSRGANGVIIVETKSGSSSGPQVTYSNSLSSSRVTRGPDMLNADQFRAVVAERIPSRVQYLGSADTDWRDAVQRDAMGQEHSVAVSGGAAGTTYRVSMGYLDQEGVVQGSDLERISSAFNLNHRAFDNHLTVRASARGARTEDRFTPGAVVGSATIFDPTQPIVTGAGFYEATQFPLGPNNPVAELSFVSDEGTTYRGVGNLEAQYRLPFFEALAATVRLGYDVAKSERRTFIPRVTQSQVESPTPGFLNRSNPTETSGLFESFVNYTTRFPSFRSDFDATAGYSYESTRGDYPYFEARGLETDLLGPDGVPAAEEYRPTLSVRESKLASFFGRVNYTYNDRYLLTLSVRRDGSSRFGQNNQWGTFPAAALAWRVNEEPWFNSGFVSDLKLRASWGVNGNQAIGDYLWVSAYEYGDPFAQVQFGDEFVTTIRPTAVDPNIKWEETTSYNVGFDYGLFDNRFTGAVEYYFKDTEDLIFRIPVAAGTNLRNYVTTNVGKVRNQGIELSLNAKVLEGRSLGGLTWDASINAAHNRNELLEINPFAAAGERIQVGDISGGVGSRIQVLEPGYAVNSFYVFRHIRDANGNPIYADTNGDGSINDADLYEDVNGDGSITQDDRRPMENPSPDWILGHTSSFGFRNADLSFTLRAYLGNYVYNNVSSAQGFYNNLNAAGGLMNLHTSVLENGFVEPQYFSDVYLEDASFLRMDNITLGYTLPNFRGVKDARIFGTVQNVFTLTGYDGVDPTAGLNGIDNNIYPRSRTFSAGISIGF